MKILLFALALFTTLPAWGQPNDLTYTKRLVGDRWVDLTPLTDWLRLPDAERSETNRPFKSWKTLVGTKVGVSLSQSWIVLVTVDGAAPARVALWNPPVREFDEFTKLQLRWRQLQDAKQHLTEVQEAATRSAARARIASDRAAARNIDNALIENRPITPWEIESTSLAIAQRNLLRANANATEADLSLADIEKGLARLKAAGEAAGCGSDFDRDYEIRCLALDVNRRQAGLAVFDRGVIPK